MRKSLAIGPELAPLGRVPGHVPDIDVQRLLYDTSATFNPLHQESLFECQAVGVRDGRVLYNLALPHDMNRFFMVLLESMIGVFRVMDIKSKSAVAKFRCLDPAAIDAREMNKREYSKLVCSLFDGFIGHGHAMNDAVKLTNSALKAEKHPWATYGLVSGVLRSEGKLRKNKRINPERRTL